jgi:hypothetical protein
MSSFFEDTVGIIAAESYGAKGDGVTDDTEALQAALDAAHTAGGGTILLAPNGVYKCTDILLIYGNTEIAGLGNSIIRTTATTGIAAGGTTAQYHICLSRFWLDSTCTTSGAIGLDLTRVSYSRFTDFVVNTDAVNAVGIKLTGRTEGDTPFYNEFFACVIGGKIAADAGTGVLFEAGTGAGANENHFFGGRVSGWTVGAYFEAGDNNLFAGTAFESAWECFLKFGSAATSNHALACRYEACFGTVAVPEKYLFRMEAGSTRNFIVGMTAATYGEVIEDLGTLNSILVPGYNAGAAYAGSKLAGTTIISRPVSGSGATGSRPSSPSTAEFYFDTTLKKPIWYTSTGWADAAGTAV